tara:strand:+ start:981 stop:1298 length:318 start_codon:yes stop_codon:yes gene_type:complete
MGIIMKQRAKKILPFINEINGGFPVTINGDHFEMTGIDSWVLYPQTIELIWTLDQLNPTLREAANEGCFEGTQVRMINGHLIARIPIQDFLPCIEAYREVYNGSI